MAAARFDIRPLLFPRSLAVVGASDRTGEVLRNVGRGAARVGAVHPTRTEVAGIRCYPSVAELPFTPELALLLVGHARVEQAFEQAAEAGVRAFVLPGVGAEAGPEGPPIA